MTGTLQRPSENGDPQGGRQVGFVPPGINARNKNRNTNVLFGCHGFETSLKFGFKGIACAMTANGDRAFHREATRQVCCEPGSLGFSRR